MISPTKARKMTNAEMTYTIADLKAVIAIQEETVRHDGPRACPKLGEYWDDLSTCAMEMKRRNCR